jgi:hypothetical protein
VEQPVEQVGTALVADAEAATAEQPGERALDDPALSSESFGGVDAAPCEPRGDAASAQCES